MTKQERPNVCWYTIAIFNQPLCFLWSICWINWNQKLKLKTNFFLITLWLCYTLSAVFLSPLFKLYKKKSSNFHLHQEKIFWFLVFSFRFWFQLIQRIDHWRQNNIFGSSYQACVSSCFVRALVGHQISWMSTSKGQLIS